MGELADMILDGLLCQFCGAAMPDDSMTCPRSCSDCDDEDE